MSSLTSAAGDVSAILHSKSPLSGDALKALQGNAKAGPEGQSTMDDAKARDAANKFEALLIHNMLKSMRKTTMGEEKSNDRAIYDDMLDERLADTMMQAGGIGIADQIVAQIQEQQGTKLNVPEEPAAKSSTIQRLRALVQDIQPPAQSDENQAASTHAAAIDTSTTDIGRLRMATGLWGNEQSRSLSRQQSDFVQPLIPHAQRNAQKLGTSAAAILAVAALETGWGRSVIKDENGTNSYNLFGIKATGSDNRYAKTLTTEYIEGKPQKLHARFKTYENEADAVNGFADFILANPRYQTALQHAGNPERFLQELQTAGYATDPRYAQKAISIMRQIARDTLPL